MSGRASHVRLRHEPGAGVRRPCRRWSHLRHGTSHRPGNRRPLALEDGTRLRLAIRLPIDREFRVSAWRELAVAPFAYDTKTWYRLEASAEGDRLRGFVDGKLLIDVRDAELGVGLTGVTANMPAASRRSA